MFFINEKSFNKNCNKMTVDELVTIMKKIKARNLDNDEHPKYQGIYKKAKSILKGRNIDLSKYVFKNYFPKI